MWWLWIVGGLAVWLIVGFAFALVVGKGIRLADARTPSRVASGPLTVADVRMPAGAARRRRRAIPLPTVGVVLVALAVGLETAGFAFRLSGSRGSAAQLFSMDAPLSLPRMFVALLFASAAFAAVVGAVAVPGRRTWWLAVAAVAGGIAAVKAGSTVHANALAALQEAVGASMALLVSGLTAAAVIGALLFLSRNERRDRRRIGGVLTLYAGASIGLSAVSGLVADVYGGTSSWAAGSTFLEESGEALAAVAFLIAVLVGVAPRLVLPRDWALRREVDVQSIDLPDHAPAGGLLPGPFGR